MRLILPLLIAITLLSCNQENKDTTKEDIQAEQSKFTPDVLNGYFPKNDIEFKKPIKTLIATSKGDFDNYFGVAKTMKNKIPSIDFKNNNVVAILTKPTNKKKKITIIEATLEKEKLVINYKVSSGKSQSFSSNALKIFKIPTSVTTVDFNSDNNSESITVAN